MNLLYFRVSSSLGLIRIRTIYYEFIVRALHFGTGTYYQVSLLLEVNYDLLLIHLL